MSEAVVEKRTRATSVKDVAADVFIAALAAHLKKTGKVRAARARRAPPEGMLGSA